MYTMAFEITVGDFKLAMLDKVEIHKSVEILADRATITLPAARHNIPLEVESKLRRGDKVRIALGYEELGLVDEFEGFLQRIESDTEKIVLRELAVPYTCNPLQQGWIPAPRLTLAQPARLRSR